MNPLEVVDVMCPWCSEPISLTVDVTESEQEYSEDCTVCCSPMTVRVAVGVEGAPDVNVEREGG
ncbi:CPXCG motif-containing cysteine-rich protein [Marinobacterium sp. A346]|uniref:CPXCG motif-containing cysteine-rich protein n=2 Tax=Marinobacterium weihaiense TaxID=2851016 RepID=A0ABS6MBZ4_9GAMM|nr:CPXCG motif-containing cysteine-rich protein [Marinobacterium weihaiense]